MRLLLDTHALIWFWLDPSRFSAKVAAALRDVENEVLVSAVSAYEIEWKRPRDADLQRLPVDLRAAAEQSGLAWLSMDANDAVAAAKLPLHHRDPWDRILIAQAHLRGLPLVSKDAHFSAYGAQVFW